MGRVGQVLMKMKTCLSGSGGFLSFLKPAIGFPVGF